MDSITRVCFSLLSGMMGFMVCGLIVLSVGLYIKDSADVVWYYAGEQPLVSIKAQPSVSGSGLFFLQVSSDNDYYYYVGDNTVGYSQHHVSPYASLVFETDSTPKVIWYKPKYKNPDVSKWIGDIDSDWVRYGFYIPKGSILHQYSVQ